MYDLLSIVKGIIQSDDAIKQIKMILNVQETKSTQLHALCDLFSVTIAYKETPCLVGSALLQCIKADFESFYLGLCRHVFPGKSPLGISFLEFNIYLSDTGVIKYTQFILAALASENDNTKKSYQSLKEIIPHYYENASFLLAPMMATRFLYENKACHAYLSKNLLKHILYDDLFYEIHLAFIAYSKAEYSSFALNLFQIINQTTYGLPSLFLFGTVSFLLQTPLNISLQRARLNSIVLAGPLSIAFKTIFEKKQLINTLYPANEILEQIWQKEPSDPCNNAISSKSWVQYSCVLFSNSSKRKDNNINVVAENYSGHKANCGHKQ